MGTTQLFIIDKNLNKINTVWAVTADLAVFSANVCELPKP
jgi:hypothetical protein